MSTIQKQKKALVEEMMRESIKDAAIKVIQQHGWKGTTMAKIAKAAGVSKGTLYNYFEGKLDMLVFVGKYTSKDLMTELQGVRTSPLPPAERVDEILRVMMEHLKANRKITACFVDAHMNDPEAREYLHQHMCCSPWHLFFQSMEEAIQEGVQEGIFYPLHPRTMACIFQHNFFLLAKLLADEGKPHHDIPFDTVPEEEIIASFREFHRHGLIRTSKEVLQV